MRDAGLRGCDRPDLAGADMDAVTKHGPRREQSALLVNVGVILRRHKKMMHLFDLLAVLGQMCLQVSFKTRRQFCCTPHHFFRAGHGKARTKCVFEAAILGAMPFAAKPFAFHKRNGQHLFWLQLSVGTHVHHHFSEDDA